MTKLTDSKMFADLEKRARRYKWLPNDWSDWGLLFRFLVVIARLLDKPTPTKKRRQPSPYSTFVGKQMKAGVSMHDAAQLWREKRNGR